MENATNLPRKMGLRHKGLRKEGIYGTVFAVLPLVGFVLFSLIPIAITFVTMFTSMNGYRFETMRWNISPTSPRRSPTRGSASRLAISLYVTLAHMIGLIVALATAAVLSQKLKGAKFFTALFFIPYICSSVAVAIMWRQMFNGSSGIINEILKFFGSENGIDWMNNTKAYTPMLIIVTPGRRPATAS